MHSDARDGKPKRSLFCTANVEARIKQSRCPVEGSGPGATWFCLSDPPTTHVTSILLVARGLLLTGHRFHTLGGEKQENGAVLCQERLNIPRNPLWTSVCISRVITVSPVHSWLGRRLGDPLPGIKPALRRGGEEKNGYWVRNQTCPPSPISRTEKCDY